MRTEIPIVVVNSLGVPVNGAQVQINGRVGGAATVYAFETGAATLLNPLATDAFGRVAGWVERGAYDAVISGTGLQAYTEQFESVPARDGAIDTAWLADSAVTAAKLAPGAATPAANSITAAMLQDNVISLAKMADLSVGTSELIDAAVTQAKLAAGAAGQGYGTAFPTSGLYNGYRYGLFVTPPQGGTVLWHATYRADLDPTYPWFITGRSLVLSVGASVHATSPFSPVASSAAITVPRSGRYTARAFQFTGSNGGNGVSQMVAAGNVTGWVGGTHNDEYDLLAMTAGQTVYVQVTDTFGNINLSDASVSAKLELIPQNVI